MNTSHPIASPAPSIKSKRSLVRFLWNLGIVLFVLFLAAGFLLPLGSSTCVKGSQTKALAQAKQIGLALKLYAGDHNGTYPAGTNDYGQTIQTSNDAFRSLFSTYIQGEMIFGNKLSVYQTVVPDGIISPTAEILKPGENTYSYVEGVTDSMPPETPLVADGTDGTGHGYYQTSLKVRGGVWGGTKAIVIRLDNSGAVENLAGPADARYVPRNRIHPQLGNLLGRRELGPTLRLLDPAVAVSGSR